MRIRPCAIACARRQEQLRGLVLEHCAAATSAASKSSRSWAVSRRVAAARAGARVRRALVVESREALLATQPQAVIEAASHEAVREHLVPLLEAGIGVVVLSAGALADDALRARGRARRSRKRARCLRALGRHRRPGCAEDRLPRRRGRGLHPGRQAAGRVEGHRLRRRNWASSWIGLKAPRHAVRRTAREGVPHFPQNVNIAAVLSLAGIGLDRTRLKVVADPALDAQYPHHPGLRPLPGASPLVLENVPAPENPKTSWLACYSALPRLQALRLPGALRHLSGRAGGSVSFLTKRRKTHIISGSAGGVPERLKGADCKSVGLAPTLVRIQPPPPAHSGGSAGSIAGERSGEAIW